MEELRRGTLVRRVGVGVLLALLAACVADGDASIEATPLALSPQQELSRLGQTEVLALHRLRAPSPRFGGLSGAEWDGSDLLAVSDVGSWLRFSVSCDVQGRPVAVSNLRVGPLAGIGSAKVESDAEEIAAAAKGWLVAFERHHRVLWYRHGLDRQPQAVALPPEVRDLAANDGLEAMTRLPDGQLLLIAEGEDDAASSPAWIGGDQGWRALVYPHTGLFRPTAAAALPDGDVLVLERRFTLAGGPGMRLVRIAAAQVAAGDLRGAELAEVAPPLVVDNFEAMTVRPRADGRMVVTILSDDNFNPLQQTLMLTLLLP